MSRDDGTRTRLHPVAALLARLATRVLPRGAVRDRYEREFTAEMHDLSPRGQVRHAMGLLLTAWALRRTIRTLRPPLLEGTMLIGNLRPLLCRSNLGHHWRPGWTDDGGRYQWCDHCGTDRYDSNKVNWPALGSYPR